MESAIDPVVIADNVRHGDTGQKWKPAPSVGGDGRGGNAHRYCDLGARRRRPTAAVPAASCGLELGQQHRAGDVLAPGDAGQ